MDKSDHDLLIAITSWTKSYGDKIDAIHLLLHGNGKPSEGFIVRLLRLEQFARFGTRIGWLTGGAIVTGLIGYGFSLVL